MKLSVLIPVYNEKKTILKVVELVNAVSVDKEIIIVDDGSNDGTRELLMEYIDRMPASVKIIYHDTNRGKGSAIRAALEQAAGEFVIIQDADLEYDPNDYLKLLACFEQDHAAMVVYGSRFSARRGVTPFWHLSVNKFLTGLTNMLYGANLADMETCYKMFRTRFLKSIPLVSRRFDFEPEITAKILKRRVVIREIPIQYRGRWYHQGKKITWKDGVHTLWILLKYKFMK